MNSFLDNITFRRNRTRSVTNDDDSVSISQTLENTANSMPDLSDHDDEQVKILNDKLLDLEAQLQSAHREIELLSTENCKLRQTNEELLKKNSLYKKITSSPVMLKTSSPIKKSSKVTIANQTKTTEQEFSESLSAPNTNQSSQNITNSTEIMKQQRRSLCRVPANKNKICILSTNNKNKILPIAQDLLTDKYDICHYITPNGTMQQLLSGIEAKLCDYTLNDFCILLIGEEDFRITSNYFNTIIYIRDILKQITYTNVIVCVPTFKLRSDNNIYNWRIETFNNLLYLDLLTHEHAYSFDSNYNLTYDHTMFNLLTGRINDNGLRNIFEGLLHFINEIAVSYMTTSAEKIVNTAEETSSLFFRL